MELFLLGFGIVAAALLAHRAGFGLLPVVAADAGGTGASVERVAREIPFDPVSPVAPAGTAACAPQPVAAAPAALQITDFDPASEKLVVMLESWSDDEGLLELRETGGNTEVFLGDELIAVLSGATALTEANLILSLREPAAA